MFGHDVWWDQPHDKHNAKWHDYHVVKIAHHRDEVGDQVNGRQGVTGGATAKAFAYQGTRGSRLARYSA